MSHRCAGWFIPVVCSLVLSVSRLNGAEYYTNWAAAHLGSVPAQSGPTNDPDSDGSVNLAEFVFGTDPLVSGGGSAILPGLSGADGVFGAEVFEQEGHRPGVQIDLEATVDMNHWIRPWWLRTTNSLPGDPTNSVRELFTTWLSGTNVFIVRGVLRLLEAGPETANYYVATNGNDTTGNGTITKPYATLAKAVSLATTGNLIYVRGGTYATSARLPLSRSGSLSQPIRIYAYPGERPIFDCSSTADNTDFLYVSGTNWYLCGLTITNSGHNSIRVIGNNITIERCVSYGARNTGIHITGGNGAAIYPANNLVLNCDSIRSYDAPVGGNADGFSAKWSLGTNNVFRGCRAWENSDDNWDLWMGTQPVLIENCWAFRAATNIWNSPSFNGNGNGFKLGGNGTPAPHRLVGCLSFGNRVWGVDQNNNAAGQTVDQNTVWNNGGGAINLNHLSTGGPLQSSHVVRNNVAIGTVDIGSTATWPSIQTSNTWQVLADVNTNDFLSTDFAWAVAPRRDDGGLPEVPFLRPVPGGRLVDKGADLGKPFSGSAPDLGAFESLAW